MPSPPQFLLVSLVISGFAVSSALAVNPDETAENIAKGKAIYKRVCIFCHGGQGKGDGPAAFFIGAYSAPRPSDLTGRGYKFRTTPSGELPTDEDLFRVVTNGIPGYMPPFVGFTAEERWQVVWYVKALNPDFKEEGPEPLAIGFPSVPSTSESIERGRTLYLDFECDSCHGKNGRGESAISQAGELKDSQNLPIPPADLTNLPSFKNGASARAIARSILTGLDGTPMPSYADTFLGQEEDVWHLVNYILSLSRPSHHP